MANPNPQLEAALAQFAAQPGTTPDQEAQLRAAVIADADRLDLLNQQAAAGQLKGFALETPGGAPNLTGAYDKAAGVVTLPVASFQPGGTAAGDDLKAVVDLQAITVDFAHKTYQDAAKQTHTVSQDMVTNLQSTLNGSPVLASQIKDAVTQGHVQHFSLLDGSMSAGATYDGNTQREDGTPKGINLPPLGLQTNSPANPQGKYDAQDMTFVLGHEIQHGFNDAAKDQARSTFLTAVNQQARVRGPLHDYTDELRAYVQAGREDEAKAEIAGWNALLSREQQSVPSANLDHMLFVTRNDRVRDFVVQDPSIATAHAIAKPGLTFNQDGSLAMTAAEVDSATQQAAVAQGKTSADVARGNMDAMGQHYFDRPSPNYAHPGQRPVHLGNHKDLAGNPQPSADYSNYYGTWALEQIVTAEDRANVRYQGAKPQITIDMAGLGLKEDLIEMEGLDLGRNKAPRPYLDTSQTPAAPGHFHHTQNGSVNPQHDHQYVPVAPAGRISPSGDPVLDRWIDALQDGNQAQARSLAMAFAQSPEGQRIWTDTLAEVRAEEAQQKPWLAQARETPLFNQALDQLDKLGPQLGQPWTQEQREQLAGAIALEAKAVRLSSIDALVPTRDGMGLTAVSNNPTDQLLGRRATVDPTQAAEQPLQQSMQQFNEETQRQANQAIEAQQRQEQSRGMSM